MSSDVVLDAFLKRKELLASRHARSDQNRAPGRLAMVEDERLFFESMRASGGEGIFQSLKKAIPFLGSTLAKEILFRADIRLSAPISLATTQLGGEWIPSAFFSFGWDRNTTPAGNHRRNRRPV